MKRLLALPLSVKLLAPAGFSLLCLALYLVTSVFVLERNSERLQSVRDVHFPMLDTLTRNKAQLDDLINGLNSAVAASDTDLLAGTEQTAQAIADSYQQLQLTDRAQAREMATLGKEFADYYAAAHAVAEGFIDPSNMMADDAIEQMTSRLDTYRQHLETAHKQADVRFQHTVQSAVDESHQAMIGGVALGLLGIVISLLAGMGFARAISRPLKRAMQVADAVANGRLDADIRVDVHDEGGRLLLAMARMQDQLRAVIDAQRQLAEEHDRGNISHRIDASAFPGDYGQLVQGTNALVDDLVGTLRDTLDILQQYSVGDFRADMPPLPGDKARLSDTVASIKQNLQAINVQIQQLAHAAAAGDFSQRGDSARFAHAFADMVEGLNTLMTSTDRSLGELSRVMQALATGDLSVRMQGEHAGVFSLLRQDADAMAEHLTGMIDSIAHVSRNIAGTAGELTASNAELSSRTESQAANLEETVAAMDTLTQTVRDNTGNAQRANQLVQGTAQVARQGGVVVDQVITTMSQIQASSSRIADITAVVDSIAFQTNILALNAAVEAARAGEQGRGFAVVATEVRSLAQRSASAAKEIGQLIADSTRHTAQGTQLADQAGRTMREIMDSVSSVTALMGQISHASEDQADGIGQVGITLAQMDQATQQNASMVEEAVASAQSLTAQARQLNDTIASFRLT